MLFFPLPFLNPTHDEMFLEVSKVTLAAQANADRLHKMISFSIFLQPQFTEYRNLISSICKRMAINQLHIHHVKTAHTKDAKVRMMQLNYNALSKDNPAYHS